MWARPFEGLGQRRAKHRGPTAGALGALGTAGKMGVSGGEPEEDDLSLASRAGPGAAAPLRAAGVGGGSRWVGRRCVLVPQGAGGGEEVCSRSRREWQPGGQAGAVATIRVRNDVDPGEKRRRV